MIMPKRSLVSPSAPFKGSMLGITLVELIVAVAIVAVLASIALPSYWGHMNKSRRVDATHTLIDYAAKQELYFAQHGGYTGDLSELNVSVVSPEEFYDIKVDKCESQDDYSVCYILKAKAKTSAAQKDDNKCAVFTLDSKGVKGANEAIKESQTVGDDSSDFCW